VVEHLANRPDLLPRAAQAVAGSIRQPHHPPRVLLDLTGTDDLPATDELTSAVLVDVHDLGGERARLVQRSAPPLRAQPTLVDLRPGDTLVVARAENLGDPHLRAAYATTQAHGLRLAVPLASTAALVDALTLLGPLDAGIYCTDDRTFRAASRASADRAIAVHRVDGKDVVAAAVRALLH
jgi:hypothetical protein